MVDNDNQFFQSIPVELGPVGKLTIFEVTEAELETLERGAPVSLFLNLGIFVLSTAISFSVTLATTTIASDRLFTFFVVITVVGYLAGLTFGLLWWFARRSVRSVAQEIRKRLPPKGVRADAGHSAGDE